MKGVDLLVGNKVVIPKEQAKFMVCMGCIEHNIYNGDNNGCTIGDKSECDLIPLTINKWKSVGILKTDPVEEADNIIKIYRKRWIEGCLPMNVEHIVKLIEGYEYLRGQVKG